jgi:hypothetical protein
MDYKIAPQPESDYSSLVAIPAAIATAKMASSNTVPASTNALAINLRNSAQDLEDAQRLHAGNSAELNAAQQNHEYWHGNDAIKDNLPSGTPESIRQSILGEPSETPLSLTPKPAGGEGTANYAKKFGATEPQSLAAPSMSTVQSETIPGNVQGIQKVRELSPSALHVEESPLMLDPAAQRAKLQMMAADRAAQGSHAAAVQDVKDKVSSAIQPHKDLAQNRLSRAQMNFDASKDNLNQLSMKNNLLNNELTSDTARMKPTLAAQAENVASQGSKFGDFINAGGRLIRKVAAPLNVAMIPSEIQSAQEAYNKGDYRGALGHGLGAAGGALTGLGEGALALGLAPELAGGAAIAGGLAGAASLGNEAYENWPAIKKWTGNQINRITGQ